MDQKVIIVIPAHNEEHTIAAVIHELRMVAPDFDRVIVNDCSSDATSAVIAGLGEKQLKLVCNLGYGQALQTGLKYALLKGHDIIVSMDADGQHQPGDVVRLVSALQESGADMVIGSRFCDGHEYDTPIDRRLGQLLFSYLTQILLHQWMNMKPPSSRLPKKRTASAKRMSGSVSSKINLYLIPALGVKLRELPP